MKRSFLSSKRLATALSVLSMLAIVLSSFGGLMMSQQGVEAAPNAAAEVKEIQVIQVLGRQYNNENKYVAGKDTVIRVVLSEPTAVDAAQQKLAVKRDGTLVTTLEPAPKQDTPDSLTFTCPNRGACGDWAKGKYVFEATIGTATKSTNELAFVERRTLKILAVPVKAHYAGTVKGPTELWKQGGSFMRQVFPTSPAAFNWQLGQELDASDARFDLKTNEGMRALWEALRDLQPKECANDPAGPTCYDLIIGFVPDRQGKDSNVQGYTMGAPANVVTESDEDMLATVAHEVAHVYKIGDEYDQMNGAFRCEVNPPPPVFVGRDWAGENMQFKCTDSKEKPFPVGTGSLVAVDEWFPYEVGGRGALPDMISYMGSGAPQAVNWTTARIWSYLFDKLAPGGGTSQRISGLAAAGAPQRFIYASGFISKDANAKVILDPWWAFMDAEPFLPTKGAYSVEAVDKDGKVLASEGFDVAFFVKTNPPQDLKEAPFEVAFPFPEGAAKFLVKKGSAVIGERVISANAPTVKVLTPKGGESLDGSFTITWEGKDADGDKLYYDVEYSKDGSEDNFFYVATSLTEAKWTENFRDFPGGDKALIRISVSDGINTGEANSAPFKVALKPPEVFIDEPLPNAIYEVGEEVILSGAAYDVQIDDWLVEDNQLVWTSDKDGELGGGEMLYGDTLSKGQHTITLKATSSTGLTASANVKITVVDKGTKPKQVATPTVAPKPTAAPTVAPTATPAPPKPTVPPTVAPTVAPQPTTPPAPVPTPTKAPASGGGLCGSALLALAALVAFVVKRGA